MSYWIKLYTEILHDPKMGKLNDHLWKRTIEMFLIASENGGDGVLPSMADLEYILRAQPGSLEPDLNTLKEVGILILNDQSSWVVKNYAERQAPSGSTSAERMRRFRNKRSQKGGDQPLDVTESESDTESDQIESESESYRSRHSRHIPVQPSYNQSVTDNVTSVTSSDVIDQMKSMYDAQFSMAGEMYPDFRVIAQRYPEGWIIDALHAAAKNNARSFGYVIRILENRRLSKDANNTYAPQLGKR